MMFVSYAQSYEDLFLYVVLGDVKSGFYIDVGANDPIDISVTKVFYDMGWRGINIEPLSDRYEALECERKRDINLCVGCGSGEVDELYLTELGTGSTFSKQLVENNIHSRNRLGYST